MLQSAEDAGAHLQTGPSLLGPGWREIESFEDLSDEDEYTTDEEEIYAVLDFGQASDRQQLQTESTYQLVGIDTPVPFLKLGNQVYQGEMASIIGDEVILGMVRDPSNPSQPSHPPLYTSSHHMIFRPITLFPKSEAAPPVPSTENLEAPPPPKRIGRPKGSTTKPRVVVDDESEVKLMDMGSLPDDVVIEIVQPQIEGEAPVPNKRLTKHQAERLMAGLPLSNRRAHDPSAEPRKSGRRSKKTQPPADARAVGEEEQNAEAGPSNTAGTEAADDPEQTVTGRQRRRAGKGKSKATGDDNEHPATLDDEDDVAAATKADGADLPLGALYFATRQPAGSKPAGSKPAGSKPPATQPQGKRPRGRPRKVVQPAAEGTAPEGAPSASEAMADDAVDGARGNTGGIDAPAPLVVQSGSGDGGEDGDVEMQEASAAENAPSPLMQVDDE